MIYSLLDLDLVQTMDFFFGIRKVVRNSMNWHRKKRYTGCCDQYSYKVENKNHRTNQAKGWACGNQWNERVINRRDDQDF
jgi:hypothetical protein